MKLAILQNSDVMEKNGFRIRTQRPKIVWKPVVLLQDKKLVDLCNVTMRSQLNPCCHVQLTWKHSSNPHEARRQLGIPIFARKFVCLFVSPPNQTTNDWDLEFGTHPLQNHM